MCDKERQRDREIDRQRQGDRERERQKHKERDRERDRDRDREYTAEYVRATSTLLGAEKYQQNNLYMEHDVKMCVRVWACVLTAGKCLLVGWQSHQISSSPRRAA